MVKMNEWDEIYNEYEYNSLPWHTDNPDATLVSLIEKGLILPGKALDLGCGAGTNSIYLASKGFRVVGIDISKTAVEIAKKRCIDAGRSCKFYVGDVLDSELLKHQEKRRSDGGDEKFDFVFDRGCFHHLTRKDKPKYMRIVHDYLRNGGKFFLQCFSDKNPPFEKNISKEEIYHYFSRHFEIKFILDTMHEEPGTKEKRYMYTVFMEKMH